MPDTLLLLRLEHRNLGHLLGLIEDQVAAADAGAPLDTDLLNLAWEYFSDYPDLCHHPKEDLVYELLSRREPGSCAGLKNLAAEHVRLHELTEKFGDAVRRLRREPRAAETEAREVIREFTQRYRQHMREEDERFFPLAEQQLSKDEWAALDFAIFDRDDPLFENAVEQRFLALHQRIEAATKEGKARTQVLDAGNRLRGLSGIDSFNELMKSGGTPFRLSSFAGGGYGLEHERELLLYVPECSAERAVWCAYCYLCGRGWPWSPARSVG
ncbi:MAG: hemerythrin domain-containing protein [Steroidobacteraceae bacterium]|jgi:hemerythrin-like domain-containing protein